MMSDVPSSQRGQVIVLFALALVALVAMVGLVIDGGGTYAQRRAMQSAADLAALAGADALINGADTTQAATDVATANGYTTGSDTTVTVTTDTSAGTVKVDINAPHRNSFAAVVGMSTWPVTVTATAVGGVPTGVTGAAPIIFSNDVFDPLTGLPYAPFTTSADYTKTQGSGSDAPLAADNMAWTNLGTGNVSSNDVKNALEGKSPINEDPVLDEYIGQQDNGVQNDLFNTNSPQQPSVNTVLAGQDVVVPIVGPPSTGQYCDPDDSGPGNHTNGCFRGWALFHIDSAQKLGGTGDGRITGYFTSGISRSASATDVCTAGVNCPGFRGLWVVKLIN